MNYRYQVGGSLVWDAPSYVVRQADLDFLQALKSGEFCYVFNARQMGKSSLRVRAMRELQKHGVRCGVIDATLLGSQLTTPEQWYASFISSVAQSFELDIHVPTWWRAHDSLSMIARLTAFFEQFLIQVNQPVVIFLDEIDYTLGLSFPLDDFFVFLRAIYDRRSSNPLFRQLTWALLGVTTPYELMNDPRRSGFNLGHAIELTDFQEHEIFPLAQGLVGCVAQPMVVLREILRWTNGQPFLTQKICSLVSRASQSSIQGTLLSLPPEAEGYWVDQLVQTNLIQDWEVKDNPEHLRTVRDRLVKSPRSSSLLALYGAMLDQIQVVDAHQAITLEFVLTGLVERRPTGLVIKNKLYEAIFSRAWLEQEQAILALSKSDVDRRLITDRQQDLQPHDRVESNVIEVRSSLDRFWLGLVLGLGLGVTIGIVLTPLFTR